MKLSGKETEMLYGRLKETLIEETERQAGILGLGKEAIKEFINNPESIINGDYKGVNFSDRIWTNGYELRNDLQKGLQRSMLQGYNPREWSRNLERNLKERMGDTGKSNSFFNAFRLAVTESARVQTMTSLGLMTKGGYEKYMWIAEPDACSICSPYDGEVFDIKNSSLGDDLPPLHPFCRCSIAAYYDMDEDEDLWYNNSNSIELTDHAEERRKERGISQKDINDTMYNPLKVFDVVIDELGRSSQKYIGNRATVIINPETKKEITSWKTSSKLKEKYKKGKK